MEKDASVNRKIRRTKREIAVILSEYHKSNMSPDEFCKSRDLHKAVFYKWISRQKKPVKNEESLSSFAPIEVTTASSPLLFAEVNGIKLYQPVSAAFLKLLVK